eukprot:jgi/Mesvir1/8951/Mv06787-RA.1
MTRFKEQADAYKLRTLAKRVVAEVRTETAPPEVRNQMMTLHQVAELIVKNACAPDGATQPEEIPSAKALIKWMQENLFEGKAKERKCKLLTYVQAERATHAAILYSISLDQHARSSSGSRAMLNGFMKAEKLRVVARGGKEQEVTKTVAAAKLEEWATDWTNFGGWTCRCSRDIAARQDFLDARPKDKAHELSIFTAHRELASFQYFDSLIQAPIMSCEAPPSNLIKIMEVAKNLKEAAVQFAHIKFLENPLMAACKQLDGTSTPYWDIDRTVDRIDGYLRSNKDALPRSNEKTYEELMAEAAAAQGQKAKRRGGGRRGAGQETEGADEPHSRRRVVVRAEMGAAVAEKGAFAQRSTQSGTLSQTSGCALWMARNWVAEVGLRNG